MSDEATGKAKYFMEDPREKKRLVEKVDADAWAATYVKPRVKANASILDVGCGPAALAKAVAGCLPESQVTGLEQSDDRFAEATKNLTDVNNAKVVQGNACEMPLEADQFDFAYTRFMLEYLKEPQQAIAEMVRVVRQGGRVMLQDLDGQLLWHYPVDEQLQTMLETTLAHLGQTGFDPFIGRKLFHFAQQAGLTDIDVQAEPYHFYPGRIDEKNYELWEMKLDIAMPKMEEALASRERAEELKRRFLDYFLREDTLTYSIVFTVTGTRSGEIAS